MTVFTALVIANDFRRIYQTRKIRPIKLFISGGGAKNPLMMKEILSRCRGMTIGNFNDLGIPIESMESFAFAVLAWWHVLRKTGTSSSITGAKHSTVLGIKSEPPL